MTSPPLTPDPTATDPLARARRRARDGWFFVVLSLLALGSGIGAERWLHGAREEGAIAAFIGLISAVVFFGFAAVKLTQAWRDGLTTLGLGTAGFAAFICVLAVLGHLLTRWLIPASWNSTDLIASTVSLLILGIPLLRAYINSKTEALERAACAIVASVLCMIYVWALICVTQKQWLIFGISGMRFSIGRWLVMPGVLPLCVLIASIAAIAFLVRGGKEYRAAMRKASTPSTPHSGWIPFAAWLSVAMMLTLFVSIFITRTANYWMVAAAIFFIVPAVMAGSRLAQIRQNGPASLRRRILFTLPLLALAFVLNFSSGMMGSFAGSKRTGLNFYTSGDFSGDWIWHAPKPFRAPLASRLAAINRETEFWAYASGMVATEDLCRESLNPKTKIPYPLLVWKAWSQREPRAALSAALDVPAMPGSKLSATNHDVGAGYVVGLLGSDADVRVRFTAGYSIEFRESLLLGLGTPRVKTLTPDIIAHFKTGSFNQSMWGWFLYRFPNAAEELALANLSASPPDYDKIAIILRYNSNDQNFYAAMKSNDVIIRKFAMINTPSNDNLTLVNQLLQAAKGSLPASDGDERRLAAQILMNICEIADNTYFSSALRDPLSTTVPPITSSDESQIRQICQQAEAWLLQHAKP